MKKNYKSPEFDLVKLKFPSVLESDFSDPESHGGGGDDGGEDPFE